MKLVLFLVSSMVLLMSCSPETPPESIDQIIFADTQRAFQIQPEMQTPFTSPQPTDTRTPTLTPRPTTTRPPTATLTQTKQPTYSPPVVLLETSGTGVTETDHYRLPKCWKAVYYWSATPNSAGKASLILKLHGPTTTEVFPIVDVIASGLQNEGLSGSVLRGLNSGEYYFSSENTDGAWTLRLECQDNIAPVGNGMNIKGTGLFVSENYALSSCQNGIFNWSVEPDFNHTASLILYLCDNKQCIPMVNQVKQGMTTPLTGQVTAMLQSGTYFIDVENTLQPWSVSWECND